jgi:8-oxo-dGTP pyrophosphatase MutT (NUDIX family)
MVRRTRLSEFMGDAHVFPGGSIDEDDRGELAERAVLWDGDPAELPWRAAALRELVEEAGLAVTAPPEAGASGRGREVYESVLRESARLDATRLHYISNWVTPEGLPRRFDTRFYLTAVDEGAATRADDAEVFDDIWVTPADALERSATGEWDVPIPTIHHLELLAGFEGVPAALAHAAGLGNPERVQPRIDVDDNGAVRVFLETEPNNPTEVGQ